MIDWRIIDWGALFPALVMAITGAGIILAPVIFIRAVIRWFNRRDDPRYAKLPPDPP